MLFPDATHCASGFDLPFLLFFLLFFLLLVAAAAAGSLPSLLGEAPIAKGGVMRVLSFRRVPVARLGKKKEEITPTPPAEVQRV